MLPGATTSGVMMICRVRAWRLPQRTPCYAAFLCCVLLGGCGVSPPSATSPAPSGSNSAAVGAISDGAQLGLAWSAGDATLRRVVGVPGSAQFGTSIVAAGSYTNAFVSAPGHVALLVDKKSNLYLLALPA